MAKFNGHKNWNHWNVSLWINNDETLYYQARQAIKAQPTRKDAAELMLWELKQSGISHTPDGAPYSISSIKSAMVGM
jgi:hypothetical protein